MSRQLSFSRSYSESSLSSRVSSASFPFSKSDLSAKSWASIKTDADESGEERSQRYDYQARRREISPERLANMPPDDSIAQSYDFIWTPSLFSGQPKRLPSHIKPFARPDLAGGKTVVIASAAQKTVVLRRRASVPSLIPSAEAEDFALFPEVMNGIAAEASVSSEESEEEIGFWKIKQILYRIQEHFKKEPEYLIRWGNGEHQLALLPLRKLLATTDVQQTNSAINVQLFNNLMDSDANLPEEPSFNTWSNRITDELFEQEMEHCFARLEQLGK